MKQLYLIRVLFKHQLTPKNLFEVSFTIEKCMNSREFLQVIIKKIKITFKERIHEKYHNLFKPNLKNLDLVHETMHYWDLENSLHSGKWRFCTAPYCIFRLSDIIYQSHPCLMANHLRTQSQFFFKLSVLLVPTNMILLERFNDQWFIYVWVWFFKILCYF